MTSGWLMPWHPQPDRCPVLLCVPPAGAGCAQVRSWQAALGGGVSVIGVQLPGRENRWADPDPSSMSGAVDAVVAEVAELVAANHPIVVFGHSFGGCSATRSCGPCEQSATSGCVAWSWPPAIRRDAGGARAKA